ncbi:MAG: hypothetical protein K2L13_01900, partial [Opitutales bacterium]|nr:hypothetical protein [Opitutales bacterium]
SRVRVPSIPPFGCSVLLSPLRLCDIAAGTVWGTSYWCRFIDQSTLKPQIKGAFLNLTQN